MFQRFKGFIGAAYTLDSVNVNAQRCLNLYPEIIENPMGKGEGRLYLKSRSGLVEITDFSTPVSAQNFATTDVDTGADTITITSHGFVKNLKGQFTTTGTLPTGLSLSTDYYIIYSDADTIQVAASKGGSAVTLSSTGSGTHTFTPSTLTGAIRCIHEDAYDRLFVVCEDCVFKVTYSGGTYSKDLIGVLLSSSGIVKAATGNLSYGATQFVDGSDIYMFLDSDGAGTESFGELSTYGYTVPTDPNDITWIDGYFIVTLSNSSVFMVSDVASPNFSALSYASSEGNPDLVVGLIANHRNLWIFNEKSTEVFVNTGNPDFPFERVQGGFIEEGCGSAGSIAKAKGIIFWQGRDKTGQNIINMSNGLGSQRISTHAIEQAINSYADPSASVGYTFQENGHVFYALNFAEATWVYDLNTQLWHERGFTSGGTVGRHIVEHSEFYSVSGHTVVGHYNDQKIYYMDDSVYVDGGATDYITRLRTSPFLLNTLERFFCDRFQLDMETGVGLVSGQGSDPQVMLDWSDDGGHTWSDEAWTSAGGQSGGIGEYSTRVIWNRLGSFRQRIFRVQITDPVSTTLIAAYLKLRQAGS